MKVIFSIRYVVLFAFIVFLFSVFQSQAQVPTGYTDLIDNSTRACNTTYQNNTPNWRQIVVSDTSVVSANSYRNVYVSTSTFTTAFEAPAFNMSGNRAASGFSFTVTAYIAPYYYYHLFCAGDTTPTAWYENSYFGYVEPVSGGGTTTQETVVNIDLASTTAELEEIKAINTFGTFVFVFLGIITWLLYLFKLFGTPKKYDY